TGSQVLVDGAAAGNTRAIEDAKRLQRIDELFNILKNKREIWKQLHPGKDFPGVVVLQVDQDVQAVVVKSVFQTAAFAGFQNVSGHQLDVAKSDLLAKQRAITTTVGTEWYPMRD